jgi:hypothetical protein
MVRFNYGADPMDLTKLEQMAAGMTPDRLTGYYVKIDFSLEVLRKQVKDYEAKLGIIEKLLLEKLRSLGTTHFTAASTGKTVFESDRTTAKVTNRELLINYILEDPTNRIHLLEARASKEAAELHASNSETGELPPGVELNKIVQLNVRKARRKKGK